MLPIYQIPSTSQDNLSSDRKQSVCSGTKARIKATIAGNLASEILSDRLFELSFHHNGSRLHPWQPIDWQAIAPEQIINLPRELFLAAIAISVEVKTMPVYSRSTWLKLPGITPQIASFLGRVIDEENNLIELGLWEREESQHSAIFRQIYEQLTGEILPISPPLHSSPTTILEADRYLFQCVIAKWITLSVYLWLMSHATGDLYNAIAQLLQDELGHLAKFWGILCLRWGNIENPHLSGDLNGLLQIFCSPQDPKNLSILPSFPLSFDSNEILWQKLDTSEVSVMNAFDYLASILQCSDAYGLEIGLTLLGTLRQIWYWNQQLQVENLRALAIVSSEGYLDCVDATLFVN
jgi:hypothetical protein